MKHCEHCETFGYGSFRIPGILFTSLPDGCGFRIERCDCCERYASDESAEKAVKEAISIRLAARQTPR